MGGKLMPKKEDTSYQTNYKRHFFFFAVAHSPENYEKCA